MHLPASAGILPPRRIPVIEIAPKLPQKRVAGRVLKSSSVVVECEPALSAGVQ